MYAKENIEIDIRELAESLKAQQRKQADADSQFKPNASNGINKPKQSPEALRARMEEFLRKGWISAEPKPTEPIVIKMEPKDAYLHRLPKVLGACPYSVNEMLERGKNQGIINDLYGERQKQPKPLDEVYRAEGMLPAEPLDLYRQRNQIRRTATSPEKEALALIQKFGLR